jgi:hypothetical protein
VLFPGDLFYASFPMLSNPMKPDRPVLAWAESLERMRTLRPTYLVPSHSRPVRGTDKVDQVLDNYAKAIRYVHDETVKLINEGRTLEEIRQQVQLPEELAQLPYLQQGYGKVAWAVTGIFRQYTGRYSLNSTDLNPHTRGVEPGGGGGVWERGAIGAAGAAGVAEGRPSVGVGANGDRAAGPATTPACDHAENEGAQALGGWREKWSRAKHLSSGSEYALLINACATALKK